MARLIFQLGDGKTVDFALSAAVVTLGRSTSNDIVINNGWISSHHARFERSGGTIEVMPLGTLHGIPLKEFKRMGGVYTVIDLDSHNGVMVNGARVSSQQLRSGDKLTFGQLEAVFEESPEVASDAPPGVVPPDQPPSFAAPPIDRPPPAPPRPVTQRLANRLSPPPLPTGALPLRVPTPPVLAAPPSTVPPQSSLPQSSPPTTAPSVVPPREPVSPADSSPVPTATTPLTPPPMTATTGSDSLPAPMSAQSALASLQRDVALLEKSLGALQEGAGAAPEGEHALARGLIQRIDLLEDLMVAGDKTLPGLAARLKPLHASLLELLRQHAIKPYTVPPGQVLDVATRKRIAIVEPAPEGEGITEVAEVFRPGYHCERAGGEGPGVILRKAEVRTRRRPLGQPL